MYPRIEINLDKLKHNTKQLVKLCQNAGVSSIFGVIKVLAGDTESIDAVISSGITHIADSRIENLKLVKDYDLPKVLLRLPMSHEVEEVVKYADISLNSELDTLILLNEAARNQNKIHQVMLMFDLGDLREGVWFETNYLDMVKKILELNNIQLIGMGTNLTCYGAVIPTEKNLSQLIEIKNNIEQTFNINLAIISGGNSSSLHLIQKDQLPLGINNLRIGEAIVLGRETAYEQDLNGFYQDAFVVKAQIIELKDKPSVPIGEIGVDAFGKRVEYEDLGILKRGIVAIGKQDVYPDNIRPIDKNIEILGSSSDHLILNMTKGNYKLGDVVSFYVSYGGLLQTMTSPYVKKIYIK